MNCRVLTSIAALCLFMSLPAVDAQLFKGRGQRQSGGSNFGGRNSMQQPQERSGGLFQRGRERRAANQFGGQPDNGNNQPQQKSGLFNRNKQSDNNGGGLFNKNRSTGQSPSSNQGGLFARARERKLEAQQQQYSQNQSYSNNSQSASSYVRSDQRVTAASNLFQPSSSGTPNSIPSSQRQPAGVTSLSPESQPARPQLPSLVSATAEAKRKTPPLQKSTTAAARPGPNPASRPNLPAVTIEASGLKDRAPETPDAQPTNNLPAPPDLEAEAMAAGLA